MGPDDRAPAVRRPLEGSSAVALGHETFQPAVRAQHQVCVKCVCEKVCVFVCVCGNTRCVLPCVCACVFVFVCVECGVLCVPEFWPAVINCVCFRAFAALR